MTKNEVVEFFQFLKNIKNVDVSVEVLKGWGLNDAQIEEFYAQFDVIADEIMNPAPVADGKFKIPHEYLCEAIKNCYKSFGVDGIFSAFETYKSLDGVLDKKSGEKLISLYDDKQNYLYLHNVCYKGPESPEKIDEIITAIYTSGLRLPHPERSSGSVIDYTTLNNRQDSYMGVLKLAQYWAIGDGIVVLQIPKQMIDSGKPVIGNNGSAENGVTGNVLPEFVVGCLKNGEFVSNPVEKANRTTYKNLIPDDASVINEILQKQ